VVRVSDQMMYQTLAQNVDQSQSGLLRLEGEMSSGLAIQKPSDNPGGTSTVLDLGTSLSVVNGWTQAGKNAQSQLQSADQTLTTLQNVLNSAISVATQASSGTNNQEEFTAASAQISTLISQVDSLANTTYNGQYIFSGISQTAPVVSGSFNPASASAPQTYEVGNGVSVPVSVDGNQIFNTASSGSPTLPSGNAATLLNTLSSLQADLQSGNGPGIQADLGALQSQVGNLSTVQAVVGTNLDRIQAALSQLQSTTQTLQTQQANVEQIDMASIATQLAAQETAYQAAIAAGASLNLPTLAKYIS